MLDDQRVPDLVFTGLLKEAIKKTKGNHIVDYVAAGKKPNLWVDICYSHMFPID